MKSVHGYTLLEVIVTIIIVSVMAGLALPRFTVTLERQRSGEGVQILSALRGAQERWRMENAGNYTNNLNDLDVQIPAPDNFVNVTLVAGGATARCTAIGAVGEIANVQRIGGEYTLAMCTNGHIACTDTGTGICNRLGY